MMRRLLLREGSRSQLILAWSGAFIGFLILLASLQYYLDFKKLITEENDWLRPEYIIINKPVSIMNSLTGLSGFDEEELKMLREHPAVDEVIAFRSNQFPVGGTIIEQDFSENQLPLYTDLFFESLPAKYLDIKTEKWTWSPTDTYVPVILPSDYLKLYNFGYAPAQQLPQISEQTAASVVFGLQIDSMGYRIMKKGKIAGFSDRINSILVPQEFLNYGNEKFVRKAKSRPAGRVMLVANDPSDPALLDLIKSRNYQANSEQLRNSELSKALRLITGIVVGIGLIIILLAFLGFVQYTQLSLYRKAYEIKTLLQIGYAPKQLIRVFLTHQVILFSVILIGSIALLYLIKWQSLKWVALLGFNLEPGLPLAVIPTALLIFALFLLLQWRSLWAGIHKLAK